MLYFLKKLIQYLSKVKYIILNKMNTKEFNKNIPNYDMEIKITHPTIIKFYQQYPHIDCETVNLSMINMINLFLNEDQQSKDNTIIEKMFSKLTSLELFINK